MSERDDLLRVVKSIEAVLRELLSLGGERLRRQWPGVIARHRIASQVVAEPELLDDAENRAELNRRLTMIANAIYGGHASFADFGITGPSERRFEELKDELSRLVSELGAKVEEGARP